MCLKSAKTHRFSSIFCTDTNRVHCAQVFFYEALLSIVSLEVFAEPCDLGQGLREAINNSEHGGAVFRANFEKTVPPLFHREGRKRLEQHQMGTARWVFSRLLPHVCLHGRFWKTGVLRVNSLPPPLGDNYGAMICNYSPQIVMVHSVYLGSQNSDSIHIQVGQVQVTSADRQTDLWWTLM